MPLAVRLGKGKEAIIAVLRDRLKAWRDLPGWREDRIRVELGKISVIVGELPISDLNPLRGLYVDSLAIARTKVTELRPLAGMRLRSLSADNVNDLQSLEGLEGAPLEVVFLSGTRVSDLSPLTGAPIRALRIAQTLVTDLSPLRNCPLDQLAADYTAIRSIEVLRGKMLKWLTLDGCKVLTDISPLKDCPTLEELTLPRHAVDIEFLRTMPRLRKLSYGPAPKSETAAEFWKEHDAKKAAGK